MSVNAAADKREAVGLSYNVLITLPRDVSAVGLRVIRLQAAFSSPDSVSHIKLPLEHHAGA